MKILRSLTAFFALLVIPLTLLAADITGTWTASFDTQIGQQNYTYEFKVDGSTLSGSMKSGNGESSIEDGKVEGDNVSFTENMNYQDTPLKITYTGRIV